MLKKSVLLLPFFLFGMLSLSAQDYVDSNGTIKLIYSYWDTMTVYWSEGYLQHYEYISEDSVKVKLISSYRDEIFTDSFNDFSRLKFRGLYDFFDIPTIPLTNILVLEKDKLILGLSRYSRAPYNIVLYNFKGKLLYKSKIDFQTLKVNKLQLKKLISQYPTFRNCLEQKPNVFKKDDTYYIEITSCINQTLDVDSLLYTELIISNRNFPHLSLRSHEPFYNRKYRYQQYVNCYDVSNPLHDLIVVNNQPYLLILNDERGGKINIPLISNCDIIKELDE